MRAALDRHVKEALLARRESEREVVDSVRRQRQLDARGAACVVVVEVVVVEQLKGHFGAGSEGAAARVPRGCLGVVDDGTRLVAEAQ